MCGSGGIGGCEGSTAELAFEYVTGSSGLYQEYQYGYTSYYGTDYECSLPPSFETSPVSLAYESVFSCHLIHYPVGG